MPAATSPTPRRRRANGEESRRKILDAATAVAGERGYEGTSISLVSERSGLPVSSIYWHFKDKDELIAAVIDRSFAEWVRRSNEMLPPPESAGPAALRLGMQRTGRALAEFPDFLRLGLMLILERRPDEPTARGRYIEARRVTQRRMAVFYARTYVDLPASAIEELARLTMVLADGLFIASEVDGTSLGAEFELMATVVQATAEHLAGATR